MTGLHLVPNDFVGYRIKPDWYSFNVVIVKRHGAKSQDAGKEYEKTVAYCKSIASAAQWILSHATRIRAEKAQNEQEALDETVASTEALLSAYNGAVEDVLRAVADLDARIQALGLTRKDMVRGLGEAEPADAANAEDVPPAANVA